MSFQDRAFDRYNGLDGNPCPIIPADQRRLNFNFEFSTTSVSSCRSSFARAYRFLAENMKACTEERLRALSVLHDNDEFLIVMDVIGAQVCCAPF